MTGQVVYANYGRPEDFAALEKLGVDVKGKIVLVRYGELFRGLKVRNAQKRGAKGILIYSDPADDGYGRGDVYPRRPVPPRLGASSAGSVQFLSLGPGDPSTPNGPSIKGAKRLPFDPRNGFTLARRTWPRTISTAGRHRPARPSRSRAGRRRRAWSARTITRRIPSLPISYDAARPILEAMGGPNVPAGWQGGLPLAYHVGPGPAEVHFEVEMDYQVRPIWNVIATIKGEVEPDRWVMIGNHRDAWVYGAVDPGSGTAATLEMCRALGSAVKQGWKPRRTLVYASWDAEEYGLVGSTEWCDQHARRDRREGRDAPQRRLGRLRARARRRRRPLAPRPAARGRRVGPRRPLGPDRSATSGWPSGGPPGPARRRSTSTGSGTARTAATDDPSKPTRPNGPGRKFSPQMNPLGSGSDYTAFLDHLGVPSLDVGFNGRYGVYHSIYDDFFWMEKFGDPEFVTHATAARLYTLIAMRAAAAEVVPLRSSPPTARPSASTSTTSGGSSPGRPGPSNPRRPGRRSSSKGLPRLVASIKAFEAQAAALDAATDALAKRDGVPRPSSPRSTTP